MESIYRTLGDQSAALSAVGYAEIAHGIHRAKTDAQRSARQEFVSGLVSQLSVCPFTREAADVAARVGAEGAMAGSAVPFADLLIGSTALSLGYSVLTADERHFRLIPGLVIHLFNPRR
jgi:predicted nucleic acid-binding protein